MKFLLSISICILSFIFSSCSKEGKSALKGCCDNEILSDTFGNGMVYLPNIFTPNGDGINDEFFVMGDSIARVLNFEIRSQSGRPVFHIADLIQYDSLRWDGKIDGVVEKGLYEFSLSVEAEDGSIGNFNGSVCNYPCGFIDDDEKISMEGCHFAIEYYWYRYFIPDPPIAELPECFK